MRGQDRQRRRFLAAGLCILGGALSWRHVPVRADPAGRTLTLFNTHTGEELTALYFSAGTHDPGVLEQFNRLLRDHRSGEVGRMDPALFDYLHAVAARAQVEPHFEVISAFRSASSNELLRASGGGGVAAKSLHLEGRAIDVRLHGIDIARLRDTALELKRGGVGYYPQSNFVHLDTGRVRRWSGK